MRNRCVVMGLILAASLGFSNVACGEVEILQTLEQQVDPKVAALLVIDVQNDFISDKGKLAKIGLDLKQMQDAVPMMNNIIKAARDSGVMVIWIKLTHSLKDSLPNYMARNVGRKKGAPFKEEDLLAFEGSWGAEYYDKILKPLPGELEVTKHTLSAFENTDLETYLKAAGIKTIICIGIVTNVCVQATAWDGWHKGYYSIMPSDAVASSSLPLHKAFLMNHKIYYGFTPKGDELMAIWKKKTS